MQREYCIVHFAPHLNHPAIVESKLTAVAAAARMGKLRSFIQRGLFALDFMEQFRAMPRAMAEAIAFGSLHVANPVCVAA